MSKISVSILVMLVALSPFWGLQFACSAETVSIPGQHFTIEVPDNWVLVPPEEVASFYRDDPPEGAETDEPIPYYDRMYQLEETEFWLECPLIGFKIVDGWTAHPEKLNKAFLNTDLGDGDDESRSSGPRISSYVDEEIMAVVVDRPIGVSEIPEGELSYLFPGSEGTVRVSLVYDDHAQLLRWKSEFTGIARSFRYEDGWGLDFEDLGPPATEEQLQVMRNGLFLAGKVAGVVLILGIAVAWFFTRSFGSGRGGDPRPGTWWRWPLVPFASLLAGMLATAAFLLVSWLSNVMFEGMGPNSIWVKYITPIMSRGVFGFAWVAVAFNVAPAYKARASLCMTSLLLALMVGVWVMYFAGSVDMGGWETVNMVLETIALAIGTLLGVVSTTEDW